MDLGDKIKNARSENGITQKELAEKTGLFQLITNPSSSSTGLTIFNWT